MTLRKQVLVFASVLLCCSALFSQTTRIGGSNTLIYLGQRFAEQYRAKHPEAQFLVRGGGSTASKATELEIVQFEGSEPMGNRVAFPIGTHAIVVYVNRANPIRELTLAQVRSIFLGQITNWKELGGADRRINLFAGESTTGTLAFFEESILHGEEPYPFEGKNNVHALLEVIAGDANAIGYGTLDEHPGVRGLAIKSGLTSLAVEPTIPTIRSRVYPITRQVYWAISPTAPRKAKEFCAWVLSAEGQLVVEGAGFQPLLPEERWAGIKRLGLRETPAVASAH
ncbi:MAG: PstS family phosphate ABC transporter substrate-binding protein [Terriglobales bacterium]